MGNDRFSDHPEHPYLAGGQAENVLKAENKSAPPHVTPLLPSALTLKGQSQWGEDEKCYLIYDTVCLSVLYLSVYINGFGTFEPSETR